VLTQRVITGKVRNLWREYANISADVNKNLIVLIFLVSSTSFEQFGRPGPTAAFTAAIDSKSRSPHPRSARRIAHDLRRPPHSDLLRLRNRKTFSVTTPPGLCYTGEETPYLRGLAPVCKVSPRSLTTSRILNASFWAVCARLTLISYSVV
jgi:hypothetical protein